MLNQPTISDKHIMYQLGVELELTLQGGVILSVRRTGAEINPLNFKMARPGGEPDEYFQGHFICAPRWGDPDKQDAQRGLKKHGAVCNAQWNWISETNDRLQMAVDCREEQISLLRTIEAIPNSPGWKITEELTNQSTDTRPVNLVQHPSLAGPFLHTGTRVDCSADTGYRDTGFRTAPEFIGKWPHSSIVAGSMGDLRQPRPAEAGLYSFSASANETSWITALDPCSGYLLGYIWNTADYPWIHHWIHVQNGEICYRGLEFGTVALHQPIEYLREMGWQQWLNQPAWEDLRPGERKRKMYRMFFLPAPNQAKGVRNIIKEEGSYRICWDGAADITIIH